MLKYRLLTAVIVLPLLIAAILKLPPHYFVALIAIAIAGGAWEWSALTGLTQHFHRIGYVIVVLCALWLSFRVPLVALLALGCLYWLWMCCVVIFYNYQKPPYGLRSSIARGISGVFFFVLAFVSMVGLRMATLYGAYWVLFALIVIMAADTGAYFSGRQWGKKPLAPRVSPKKTWVGLWGGLLSALVIGVIGSFCFPLSSWSERIGLWLICLITALFSMVGDLTISVMKRETGIKDTGSILPGHGGILDRVDSLFAGVVIFTVCFYFL